MAHSSPQGSTPYSSSKHTSSFFPPTPINAHSLSLSRSYRYWKLNPDADVTDVFFSPPDPVAKVAARRSLSKSSKTRRSISVDARSARTSIGGTFSECRSGYTAADGRGVYGGDVKNIPGTLEPRTTVYPDHAMPSNGNGVSNGYKLNDSPV